MSAVIFLQFISICAVLLIFGIIYAILIAKKPFPPRLTWLSVTVGVGVTCYGIGAMIWLFTDNWFLATLPVIGFAMTGGPMILGQITKHIAQDGGVVKVEEDDGN